MQTIRLESDWEFCVLASPSCSSEQLQHYGIWREAKVPGNVHADLLRLGLVEDFFWCDNENGQQWIGELDWQYKTVFRLEAAQLQSDFIELHLPGIDTLAKVYLNGQLLLQCNNMYRHWRLRLPRDILAESNELLVSLHSPLQFMQQAERQFHLPAWNVYDQRYGGRSWVRKMPCSFGWDWAPRSIAGGIWKTPYLEIYDYKFTTLKTATHFTPGGVELEVVTELIAGNEDFEHVCIELYDEQHQLAARQVLPASALQQAPPAFDSAVFVEQLFKQHPVTLPPDYRPNAAANEWLSVPTQLGVQALPKLQIHATLHLARPRLWWSHDLGESPLYRLNISLHHRGRGLLAERSRMLGIRSIELVCRDSGEQQQSFYFKLNNKPVFARGANWIPLQLFVGCISKQEYRQALLMAKQANMNMLRVWGGGIYENEEFYQLCDELGILVWQDAMFSCATYPAFDEGFMRNVAEEIYDNLLRLQQHPSLVLWCGNNELEQGLVGPQWSSSAMHEDDYRRLFYHLQHDILKQIAAQVPWWPASPHSPRGDFYDYNNPQCGDAHCWDVWFGGKDFAAQRQWQHRFISEFGFQSFPSLQCIREFCPEEQMWLNSYIIDCHQRSPGGNGKILQHLLDWFAAPRDFAEFVYLSQLTQALCIHYAALHARNIHPRMQGLLFWQFNDLWPCASWSCVDYKLRPKALYYGCKRDFAPLCCGLLVDTREALIGGFVVNSGLQPEQLRLELLLVDAKTSTLLLKSTNLLLLEPGCRHELTPLAVGRQYRPCDTHSELYRPHGPHARNLLVFLQLYGPNSQLLGEDCQAYLSWRFLDMPAATLQLSLQQHNLQGGYIELYAENCALFVEVSYPDSSVHFADNYVHLLPNQSRRIAFSCSSELQLRQELFSLRQLTGRSPQG